MKLEPTEAQRKAMAEVGASGPTAGWSDRVNDWFPVVHRMIAAANSIPEGAPVGTIARRPDGFWIAHMTESGWEYTELVTGTWRGPSADSWPVIFTPGEAVGSGPTTDGGETHDPREPSREELRAYFHQDLAEHCQADDSDEYHEGDKPRLERLMREPSVFDADPHGTVNLDGTLPTFTPDPTAQQEPERFPGIENPTTADHVGADNADEQLKLIFALQCIRVERGLSVADIGEALGLEDSEVERFESGSTNPTMSMIRRYARAVEAVFTVDVRKWEDTQLQQEPSVYELDRLAMESIRTTAAQQEPGESLARGLDDLAAGRVSRRDDYLEPQREPVIRGTVEDALRPDDVKLLETDPMEFVRRTRQPRVVDRLGVDEQGSRWLDANGKQWSWSPYLERWGYFRHVENGSVWVLGDQDLHGPFREILEPHVLPSLDCEEARDGTVWEARYVLLAGREQTPGWKFQHTQDGWVYEDGSRVLSPEFLTGRGPYTEVLGDPS